MRVTRLAVEIGVCNFTVRRRINVMIERGLVEADGKKFRTTHAGFEALGDAAPQPWVRVEAVSAALSKEVQARQDPDDRSKFTIAAQARQGAELARSKGLGFNRWTEYAKAS